MFGDLSDRLDGIFKTLRGHGKLSETNIKDALKEVRRAFLEADVNYKVAKKFIAGVEAESLGERVLTSVTPGQMIIKIVHDRLVALLGGQSREMAYNARGLTIWMMVGLQGSGKTTGCAKLALRSKRAGRKPLLVAADIYRPAAKDQLNILGKSLDIPVFSTDDDAVTIAVKAVAHAEEHELDLLILDTAGRLHINEELMDELRRMREAIKPTEIMLVADAMTGQDAVKSADEFNRAIGIDGVMLTKTDGDARGGAALSILEVTGRPIKFVGTGEKTSDLDVFHPERQASRILGMGDVVSLVEKAQEAVDLEKAAELEKKLRRAEFTFEDFYDQLQQVKKMGSLESILSMIPGVGKSLKNLPIDDKALDRVEAMIQSMTPQERRNPSILNGSRRMRIAKGSGNSIQDVNKIIKQFGEMQKMVKRIGRMGPKALGKMKFPL
jgi:signal recognition particle subunit SRP54